MGLTVGEVNAKLGLDASSFESGMKNAESKFSSFGSSLTGKATSIGASIAKSLAVGTIAVGAALAGVATMGVKSYSDIESAAADAASKMDLGAIAQASGTTMDVAFNSTKEHVIALSRELGQLSTNSFDPTQIAGAMANLAAGGFDVAKASAADLSPILSLATAANYDLASTAEVSLSTMNMYGMGMKDLGHISDVYTVAAGKSAAGMSDFKETMAYVGPVSKNANVSLEESVAMIGKLRDIGIPASTVGTSLRDGMQTLIAPTGAAAKALEAMGLSTSDVSLKNQDFIDVLAKMKVQADKTGEGAAAFIKVFGVTGDTLYNLAGMAPEVDKLTESLENSTGAAEKMAGFMNDTLKGAFNTAMGSAVDLAIGIGESLKPALVDTFKWFSETGAPAIQAFISAIQAGDWASVGNMISEGFKFALNALMTIGEDIWAKISPGLQMLKDKIGPTISEAFSISLEMGGLAAVGVGIALLASGVIASLSGMSVKSIAIWATTKAKSLASVTTMSAQIIAKYVKMAASSLISMTGMATKTTASFIGMVASSVASTAGMVISVLAGYASMAVGVVGSMATIVSTTVGSFVGIAAAVAAPIALVIAGLAGIGLALNPGKYTEFEKIASKAFNGLKDVVSDCWELIKTGDFSGVADRLKQALDDAMKAAKEIDWKALGKEVAQMIGDGAKATVTEAIKIHDWIKEKIQSWIDEQGPKNLGKSIAESLIGGIKDLLGSTSGESLVDKIKNAMGTAQSWLSMGWDIAKGIGSGIYDAIEPYINDTYNKILDFAIDGAVAIVGWKVEIKNAVVEIFNAFKDKFGTIKTTYVDPLSKAFDDMRTKFSAPPAWSKTWEKIEETFNSLSKSWDKLKNADFSKILGDMVNFGPGYNGDVSKSSINSGDTRNTQKIINALNGMGYDVKDIKGVAEKQLSSSTNGVKTLSTNQMYNNGLVDRKFNELTKAQLESGKWQQGTLAESKTTANKASTIADKSIETSTNTENTATNTKETTEAIKTNDGIQQKVKWTNPKTGETQELYPDQIKVIEAMEKYKRVVDYASEETKEAAEDAANTEKEGAKQETALETETAKQTNELTKKSVNTLTDGIWATKAALDQTFLATIPAATLATNTLTNETLIGGTRTAVDALQLGAQVGAAFTTEGGQAVKIGLTEAGKEIAIIGSVAQKSWSDQGKILYSSVQVAATNTKAAAENAAKITIGAATQSANIKNFSTKSGILEEALGVKQKNAIEIATANSKRTIETSGANLVHSSITRAGSTFASTVANGASNAASILSNFVGNINSGRNLRPAWAAKGAHLKQPTAVLAGEKGDELILPNNLTNMFVDLAKNYRIQNPSMGNSVAFIPRSNLNDIRESLTFTVNLIVDGKKLTSVVMPNMKKELLRAGTKRN